jgi:hypothetical protein
MNTIQCTENRRTYITLVLSHNRLLQILIGGTSKKSYTIYYISI